MRGLVLAISILLTGCGAIERAFVNGLVHVQKHAVLTQSTFKDNKMSFRAAKTARNLGGGAVRTRCTRHETRFARLRRVLCHVLA
jgi:hypothetical protein